MTGVRPDPTSADPLAGLARRAAAGEPGAARALLGAVAPQVLCVVRQVLGRDHPDQEDLVQEALLGALQALRRFRGDCSTLHFVQRVGLLTALNARRRFQLREQLAPRAVGADPEVLPGREASPAEALDATRRRALFTALLDELPPAQAEALALHCVLGCTLAETAALAGVPLNTARGRIVAAKAALRERLTVDPMARELLRGAS